jgi:RHS repeat-associated protein
VAFARGALNSTDDTISSPSATDSWSTDALGNFTSVGGTTETNNDQNEATGFGSATLAYDGNGNLTTDQNGNTLVYDAWNRLVAYKSGSTVLETLSYDGLGRRVVENAGTARDLYYSQDWQVLEERVGGATKAHYVWGVLYTDDLVLRDRDSTGGGTLNERLWAQQDADWNVTALVSGTGTVAERYAYDPYGAVTVLSASWGTLSGSPYAWIYLHQGGRLDTTTGLYGFRHRDLSPTLGRWIEVDPQGFGAGDTNLYRDLGNNPEKGTDPTGLWRFGIQLHGSTPIPLIGFTFDFSIGTGGPGISAGVGVGAGQGALVYVAKGRKHRRGTTTSLSGGYPLIAPWGVPLGPGGFVSIPGNPFFGPPPPRGKALLAQAVAGGGLAIGKWAYFDFFGYQIL